MSKSLTFRSLSTNFSFLLIACGFYMQSISTVFAEELGSTPEQICRNYNKAASIFLNRISEEDRKKYVQDNCQHFKIKQTIYTWSGYTTWDENCEAKTNGQTTTCARRGTSGFRRGRSNKDDYQYDFQISESAELHTIVISEEDYNYYIAYGKNSLIKEKGGLTQYYDSSTNSFSGASSGGPTVSFISTKSPYYYYYNDTLMGTFAGTNNTVLATQTSNKNEVIECSKVFTSNTYKNHCSPFNIRDWKLIGKFPESTHLESKKIAVSRDFSFSANASGSGLGLSFQTGQSTSFNMGGFSIRQNNLINNIGSKFEYYFPTINQYSGEWNQGGSTVPGTHIGAGAPETGANFNNPYETTIGLAAYQQLDMTHKVAWRHDKNSDQCAASNGLTISQVFRPTVSSLDYDSGSIDNGDSNYTRDLIIQSLSLPAKCKNI